MPYGSEQPLEIVGKFEAQLEYQGKIVREIIYVLNTPKHQSASSLLSRKMAIELGILTLNVQQIEEDKFANELLMYENVKNLSQNLKSILVKYSAQLMGICTLCDKSGNIKYIKLNTDNAKDHQWHKTCAFRRKADKRIRQVGGCKSNRHVKFRRS